MGSTPNPVAAKELTTTSTQIYVTTQVGVVANIKQILLVNKDSSDRQVEILRKNAAAAEFNIRPDSASNVIGAGQVELWTMDLFLGEDESIWAKANANGAVDIHISVVEMEVS